jgi:hypothetical protein
LDEDAQQALDGLLGASKCFAFPQPQQL